MWHTNNLLKHNCHLLLVYDIRGGGHISLGIPVINRGIHTLDSLCKHTEHYLHILYVRYHICRIDTCKWLIVAILKKRRRTNGKRALCGIDEDFTVTTHILRELSLKECLKYLFVRSIAECNRIKVVLFHELVEDVGTQHHSLRN